MGVQSDSMRTIVALMCMFQGCAAFWDHGHMAVSKIGFDHISSAARSRYTPLLNALSSYYPDSSTPTYAGAWMDDIKSSVRTMNSWHYLDRAVWAADYSGVRKS